MTTATKRKTSLSLDGELLDAARALGINVSAVTNAALERAIAEVERDRWLRENADTFALQAQWHDTNGHPLSDILMTPGSATWTR